MFPLRGAVSTLITRELVLSSIGDPFYHEGSTRVGAVDIALRHDKVVLCYGRYGRSTGFRDFVGRDKMFATGTSQAGKTQFMVAIEGFVEITGFDGDAIKLSQEIIRVAKQLNIEARHLAVDSTGVGEGVYSYLKNYWGDVYSINWQQPPTEMKIMKEDAETPLQKYYRVADEMWFCFHTWLSFGSMMISKACPQSDFFDQLCNRRIGKNIAGKRRVESKDEYKMRNRGVSPDHADSAIMLNQIVRARSGFLPSMNKEGEALQTAQQFNFGSIESIDSLRFNSQESRRNQPKPFNVQELMKPSLRIV